MLNIELLRDAVEWVEWQNTLDVEKREWTQGVWFADLDRLRQGHTPAYSSLWAGISEEFQQEVAEERTECGTAYCVAGYIVQKELGVNYLKKMFSLDHFAGSTGANAAELLGISESEADMLFDEDNDASDIRIEAEALAAKYGMEL